MFGGAPLDASKQEKLEQALEFLNTFLEGQNWAAGANLTIADLALVASISTIEAVGFSIAKYTNVVSWYERTKKTAVGYEVNASGSEAFKQLFLSMTSKK